MNISKPQLSSCQLGFRMQLARKRLSAYPLDSLDFIMMDLERPECASRQADWCTGDLSGRILEFLSYSDGMIDDGTGYVHELFERILRTRQSDGLFGRENLGLGYNKLLMGLLRYYIRFNDARALEAAEGIGHRLVETADIWMKPISGRAPGFAEWMTEPFAELYRLTDDNRWYMIMERLAKIIGEAEHKHAHNYLTALRGLQHMQTVTGEARWGELAEAMRRRIIERGYVGPDGDICEGLPWTSRNEACAIADWVRCNLYAGYINSDDAAYEEAEHALLNALYFSQICTGGMGHRSLAPWGYDVSEFQEAWWCCTMNGGMAMADVARHAVTLSEDMLRVNFFIPGVFTLMRKGKAVSVQISTGWPESADARIKVSGYIDGINLHIRQPSCVRSPKCTTKLTDEGIEASFSGQLGYTLNAWHDGLVTLRYGELLLAPMSNTIGMSDESSDIGIPIPKGYRNGTLSSGWLTLLPPAKDEHGFYAFCHEPVPDWTYFEEGLNSRTGSGSLSISVDTLVGDSNERRTLRFWPLSYAISTLVWYPVPIVFKL